MLKIFNMLNFLDVSIQYSSAIITKNCQKELNKWISLVLDTISL